MKNIGMAVAAASIIIASCSTSEHRTQSERAFSQINISDIERLEAGKSTAAEIKIALGEPSQIVSLSPQEDAWIYQEPFAEGQRQRAGLVIGKETGILLTATLLLKESDALHDQQKALKHFGAARFKVKDVGWIARHSYSHEATHEDPKSGISMLVNKAARTVSAISFSPPAGRRLAKGK